MARAVVAKYGWQRTLLAAECSLHPAPVFTLDTVRVGDSACTESSRAALAVAYRSDTDSLAGKQRSAPNVDATQD